MPSQQAPIRRIGTLLSTHPQCWDSFLLLCFLVLGFGGQCVKYRNHNFPWARRDAIIQYSTFYAVRIDLHCIPSSSRLSPKKRVRRKGTICWIQVLQKSGRSVLKAIENSFSTSEVPNWKLKNALSPACLIHASLGVLLFSQ